METNICEVTVNNVSYMFRIIPFLNSAKTWNFQIEDLLPTSKFVVAQDEASNWVQISGKDKIDLQIIEAIGTVIRKQYL
jgi:hypothetical protein